MNSIYTEIQLVYWFDNKDHQLAQLESSNLSLAKKEIGNYIGSVLRRERERLLYIYIFIRKPSLAIKITFKIINNIKNHLKIKLHHFVWNFDKYNRISNLQHSLYDDYSLSQCYDIN